EHRIAVADPGHAGLLHDHLDPAGRKLPEGFVEPGALVVVAADEGDVLGAFAPPRQLVAQPRLAGVLLLDVTDERAAEQDDAGRGERGVEDDWEPHVPGTDKRNPERFKLGR